MAALEPLLLERLAPAFDAVGGPGTAVGLRSSGHADFQADGALALAARVGGDPRAIAAEIAALATAGLGSVCSSVEVSGPGFLNLTVRDDLIGRLLAEAARSERLGVPVAAAPDTVVVDYSGVNAAKEMHAGHLRSTIIGDALARLLEWLGHRVIRVNHLGDWGAPFGMLIEQVIDRGPATPAVGSLSATELSAFYRAARRRFDDDDEFKERARQRVVALQSGDGETLRLWEQLVATSQRYFQAIYDDLGVGLGEGDFRGESFYNDRLVPTADELDRLGLLTESNGAAVVFPTGFSGRDGEPLPLIVRNRNGGFGYAATDLAAVRYRVAELGATRLLYVVGLPQAQHFEMMFAVAGEAGWLDRADGSGLASVEHIGFGSILGSDGRMFRSRAGQAARLVDLIDEAVRRARVLVDEKDPDLDPAERAALARAVGIGALKYGDLSSARTKDYTFDWSRMLSFTGDTAPYLQYARARILSIFRRAGVELSGSSTEWLPAGDGVAVDEPAERALALRLLAFEGVVADTAFTLEPHRLTGYLYDLASAFTAFYEACPVLRAEPDRRRHRLVLCGLTSRTLARGLDLLGIAAPDRM